MARALMILLTVAVLASCSMQQSNDGDARAETLSAPPGPDFSNPNDDAVPSFDDAMKYCDAGMPAVGWNAPEVSDPEAGALSVVGRVQAVTTRLDLPGRPTFVEVGANYPQGFSVVIFDPEFFEYYAATNSATPAPGGSLDALNGRLICAEGYVTFEDGRPQMVDTKDLNSVTVLW